MFSRALLFAVHLIALLIVLPVHATYAAEAERSIALPSFSCTNSTENLLISLIYDTTAQTVAIDVNQSAGNVRRRLPRPANLRVIDALAMDDGFHSGAAVFATNGNARLLLDLTLTSGSSRPYFGRVYINLPINRYQRFVKTVPLTCE